MKNPRGMSPAPPGGLTLPDTQGGERRREGAVRRPERPTAAAPGSAVVLDHAEHVGGDAALVAAVELLERTIVAAPDAGDEIGVGPSLARIGPCRYGCLQDKRCATHCAVLRA